MVSLGQIARAKTITRESLPERLYALADKIATIKCEDLLPLLNDFSEALDEAIEIKVAIQQFWINESRAGRTPRAVTIDLRELGLIKD